MTDHETNLEAAWARALDRGDFRTGGEVSPEACAARWPEHNAQELCLQASHAALEDGDDRLYIEHFERAAAALDAADDTLSESPGEVPAVRPTAGDGSGGGADPERVARLEAEVEKLRETVDRLEDAVLSEVMD